MSGLRESVDEWREAVDRLHDKACHGSAHGQPGNPAPFLRSGWIDAERVAEVVPPDEYPTSASARHAGP